MSDLAWMHERLAELCGINLRTNSKLWATWSPTTDVAQAVRCLEAMKWAWFTVGRAAEGWTAMCYETPDHYEKREYFEAEDQSLPRAICLAIAAALGWEAP